MVIKTEKETDNPPTNKKNGNKWWLKHKEEIMVWTSILTLLVSIAQLVFTIIYYKHV